MSRLLVPRMLAAGSLVGSATAFRVGAGSLELLAERMLPLVTRAVRASVGGADAGAAQAAFRDDALALARDWAEVCWHELRRGLDDLDAFTRPHERPVEGAYRPYRVKA